MHWLSARRSDVRRGHLARRTRFRVTASLLRGCGTARAMAWRLILTTHQLLMNERGPSSGPTRSRHLCDPETLIRGTTIRPQDQQRQRLGPRDGSPRDLGILPTRGPLVTERGPGTEPPAAPFVVDHDDPARLGPLRLRRVDRI
jgi:hypothetical protein